MVDEVAIVAEGNILEEAFKIVSYTWTSPRYKGVVRYDILINDTPHIQNTDAMGVVGFLATKLVYATDRMIPR